MHRVHGTGSVGRDELGASGEFSVRSRWWELLASGRNSISIGTQKRQFARSEEERRGMATQERMQKGQVSRSRQEMVPQNEEISGNSVKDHRWHLVPRVDCVGHAVRVMTERNPNATLFSIDGVGAYDHVLRSAMMAKVLMVPAFHLLLPFGPFIPNVPDVCGKTKRGTFMEFANTKGANRGTLSCPSSASPSRNCLRSWMTCALCRTLTRHLYHLVGEQLWSVAGIGIRMEGVFGAHRESRCWERQSGCSSSSRKLGNVISRFCSAVDPDATIF